MLLLNIDRWERRNFDREECLRKPYEFIQTRRTRLHQTPDGRRIELITPGIGPIRTREHELLERLARFRVFDSQSAGPGVGIGSKSWRGSSALRSSSGTPFSGPMAD